MIAPPIIGGAPAITLRAPRSGEGPQIVEATVLPGRGFMLLQATLERASGERLELLHAPPLADAAAQFDAGPEDFAGNVAFRFGGAILAPFANRIRGQPIAGAREIETAIGDRRVRLPSNWAGQAPGAESYAMHGLILAANVPYEQPAPDRIAGVLDAGDFAGRWPGHLRLAFEWRLAGGGLTLDLTATNVGDEATWFGAGWHPYLRLVGGDRRVARLRVPAARRAEVNDYDEVLPTGHLLDVAGTPYDFRDGRTLEDLYLDDCFTDLHAPNGVAEVEIEDRVASLGLRITGASPPVKAVQVYAPLGESFVVVEPQFNLANPFGSEWPADVDTGMVRLASGAMARYRVRVSAYDLRR